MPVVLTEKQWSGPDGDLDPVALLDIQIREAGLPAPSPEYPFCADRGWHTDRAWPALHVLVEVEGGVYKTKRARRCPTCGEYPAGRHVRGDGYTNDVEKYNVTQLLHFELYRFTTTHIRSGYAIELLTWRFNEEIQALYHSDPLEYTLALRALILRLTQLRAVKKKRRKSKSAGGPKSWRNYRPSNNRKGNFNHARKQSKRNGTA